MRLRNIWVGLLGVALAATLACGGSQETSNTAAKPESPSATPAGQKVDTATAGDVKGVVDARRHRAEERTDQDERRSGLREGEHDAADAGDLHGRHRRQVARQRVRLRQGRPRQLRVRHADRAGDDRPEELPLPSARVRHAGRPAARDRQQRSDAAQHPRDAEGQRASSTTASRSRA